MKCVKYSGAGNDFIILEGAPLSQDLIKELCTTFVVDGALFILPSSCANVKMRIFNNDGLEADMCGNGLRCVAHYTEATSIESNVGVHKCEKRGDNVWVDMGKAQILSSEHPVYFINTGVPHVVVVVDDVEKISFLEEVKKYRRGDSNVNFLQLEGLKLRTFERGVEAETLACGTGAAAAAIVSKEKNPKIQVRSGDYLEFHITENSIEMIGPAKLLL